MLSGTWARHVFDFAPEASDTRHNEATPYHSVHPKTVGGV